MQTSKNPKSPRITIIAGLVMLLVTGFHYSIIAGPGIIYHSSVGIFELYGKVVAFVGAVLTVWAYIKVRTFSKMALLLVVFAANIFAIWYFGKQLAPLPSQFRFALTNYTGTELTDVKVVGLGDLKLDNLADDATVKFRMPDYDEHTDIKLFCRHGSSVADTLVLAEAMAASCGYYWKLDLVLKNGHLEKK